MVSSTSRPPTPPLHPGISQVAASALAAVSAAVISSTFGVAGTLIGAAIASIVATVGSTLYMASLHSTKQRLQRLASAARRADWSASAPSRPPAAEDSLPAINPGDDTVQMEVVAAGGPSGWSRLRWTQLRGGLPTLRRRWLAVAGLAIAVFAIAIGVITAIEAATNQPVSALVGGNHHSGTSLGQVLDHKSKATPTPTSTPTPSTSPSSRPATAPQTPSAIPSTGASPSSSASAAPTPSPSATAPPAQGLPTPATVP